MRKYSTISCQDIVYEVYENVKLEKVILKCQALRTVEKVPYPLIGERTLSYGSAVDGMAILSGVGIGSRPYGRNWSLEFQSLTQPKGRVEKVPLRGGINSRPYGQQQLITHRAGFILKGFPSILRSSGSKDTLKGI